MTKKKKIDALIEFLTESHIDAYGGYPHDCIIFGGMLIVADLDDGKERARTLLRAWLLEDLLEWHDAAKRHKRKFPDEDWVSCLQETRVSEVDISSRQGYCAHD